MKKDAHYYAILACSRAAGLNEEISAIIAYASQFVDDARIDHLIPQKMPDVNRYDWIDGEKCFHGMASCHCYFKVKTFNYNSMINKTAAFHFVPGCKGPTFVRKMRCREDSPLSNQLVKNAIETKNPYKLGITLHAYADTFSHQGFSALMSKVNDVKKVKIHSLYYKVLPFKLVLIFQSLLRKSFDNHFDKFVPPYGHGQVLSYPDLPFLKWSYFYDYSDRFSDKYKYSGKINNPKRYQRAFIKIYNYLKEFAEKCPEYCDNSISLNLRDILHLLVVKKR